MSLSSAWFLLLVTVFSQCSLYRLQARITWELKELTDPRDLSRTGEWLEIQSTSFQTVALALRPYRQPEQGPGWMSRCTRSLNPAYSEHTSPTIQYVRCTADALRVNWPDMSGSTGLTQRVLQVHMPLVLAWFSQREHKNEECRWLGMQCRSKRLLNPAASGPGLHLSQLWFQLSCKQSKSTLL